VRIKNGRANGPDASDCGLEWIGAVPFARAVGWRRGTRGGDERRPVSVDDEFWILDCVHLLFLLQYFFLTNKLADLISM
jgi:hypothetical protein